MKKFFILGSLLILKTALAGSGDFAGNGGDGVIVDGKVYLLDLFEAGLHLKPSFEEQDLDQIKKAYPQARKALYNFSEDTQDKVIQKLLEISKLNRLMAHVMAQGIATLDWYGVDSSLLNVADEDSPVDVSPSLMLQLAVRKGTSILFDRKQLENLDKENQASLIFHELFYAFVPFESRRLSNGLWQHDYQSSFRARSAVAYIMSPALHIKAPSVLAKKLSFLGIEFLSGKMLRLSELGEFYIARAIQGRSQYDEDSERDLVYEYYMENSLSKFRSRYCLSKRKNFDFEPLSEGSVYAVISTKPRSDSERMLLSVNEDYNFEHRQYLSDLESQLKISNSKKAFDFVCSGEVTDFKNRLYRVLAQEGFEYLP